MSNQSDCEIIIETEEDSQNSDTINDSNNIGDSCASSEPLCGSQNKVPPSANKDDSTTNKTPQSVYHLM